MNLSLPKFSLNKFLSNNWPTTSVVPSAPNGIRILDTIKSMLSNIVPAPNLIPLKLPNDKVAGILMINTSILAISATGRRLVLSFL